MEGLSGRGPEVPLSTLGEGVPRGRVCVCVSVSVQARAYVRYYTHSVACR